MSFFAVLRPQDALEPEPQVLTCHINFWALNNRGPKRFICDVGLHIAAPSGSHSGISSVDLALPFEIVDKGVDDLYEKLLDKEVADLVWGEPVGIDTPVSGDAVLERQDKTPLRLGRISLAKSTVENYPERTAATAHVELGATLAPGESAYFRIRFRVRKPGQTWVVKRSGLSHNGALVDFRISDPRETWHSRLERDLRDRIVELPNLYLFVISGWRLQMRVASPELKYVRVLEGQGWSRYLDRPTTVRRKSKLLVYYWRWPSSHDEAEKARRALVERVEAIEGKARVEEPRDDEASANETPIRPVAPARAFLDLSRDPGLLLFGNLIRFGLVGVGIAAVTAALLGHKFWAGWTLSWNWVGVALSVFGLTTILALVGAIGLLGKIGSTLARWTLTAYRGLEHLFLQTVFRIRDLR